MSGCTSCWQYHGLAGRAELYSNVTSMMIVDDLCVFTGDDCHDRREAFDDQNFECYCTLFPSVLADNTDLASLGSSPIRGILIEQEQRAFCFALLCFGLPCIMMCSRLRLVQYCTP
jgi:hypothetical protein